MRYLRLLGAVAVFGLMAAAALAEETAPAGAPGEDISNDVASTIALAASAAFVTAISIVGSAYAVGKIGAAALGAAAEKPELLTRSLMFVALAEGLAVLGLGVAVMLLDKIP